MKVLLALGLLIAGTPLFADEPKKLTVEELQGTWLFDSASRAQGSDALAMVWSSKVVVRDHAIAVESFLGLKPPLKGTLVLDPAGKAGQIDLKLEEYDLKEVGPLKIPAGTLAGVYERVGDGIRFCFHPEPGGVRPKTFDEPGFKLLRMTLKKAPEGFADFPKSYTVVVTTPDGKPAKGVSIGTSMGQERDATMKEGAGKWMLYEPRKTDDRGRLKIDYADESFAGRCILAWDEANNWLGIGSTTPAAVAGKQQLAVELKPICKVKLNATCAQLKMSGQTDHFHCYAITKSGHRIAFNADKSGRLEFLLPAGDYRFNLYGSEFVGKTDVELTVPKDRSEFESPEIKLPPTALLSLLGKPAPALIEVMGWKGDAVKLDDLKGKVVLLEFWGYWCGPCIRTMPVLFELHEKFADKGLAIIGVHLDADGEVDTAAKLDLKIEGFRKEVWNGKDLPFPNALTSGHRGDEGGGRGGTAAKYGIRSYQSTILIDREGNVVGKFNARDSKEAIAQMEKLLKADKK